MSTITREFTKEQLKQIIETDHVQCGEASALARIALASLEAEPVCVIDQSNLDYLKSGSDADVWPASRAEMGDVLLYRAAPPAPVSVPDEREAFNAWNNDTDCPLAGRDAKTAAWLAWCGRAAMPHGAEPVTTAYKSPDDFICMLTGRAKYLREKGEIKSPELLERAAAALQEESVNTTPIPNGWKLVPIDPTKDMLRAGQSVVGFWLNTVHCYSKMLAAAPAAPQQEVNNG